MHTSWLYYVVVLFPFFLFGALSFSSNLLVVLLPGQPGACMVAAVAEAMIDVETKLLDTVSECFMEQLVCRPEEGEAILYVLLTIVCRIWFKVLLSFCKMYLHFLQDYLPPSLKFPSFGDFIFKENDLKLKIILMTIYKTKILLSGMETTWRCHVWMLEEMHAPIKDSKSKKKLAWHS